MNKDALINHQPLLEYLDNTNIIKTVITKLPSTSNKINIKIKLNKINIIITITPVFITYNKPYHSDNNNNCDNNKLINTTKYFTLSSLINYNITNNNKITAEYVLNHKKATHVSFLSINIGSLSNKRIEKIINFINDHNIDVALLQEIIPAKLT
eukprot:UN02936